MKRIIQFALSLSCVLGLGMGQTAFAAQFNITVPVNLSKMPSNITHVIVKGFLLCGIATSSYSGPGYSGSASWDGQVGGGIGQRQIVGVSQQIRSIDTSTGEFHSSIVLNMSVAPGYFPNNVGGYFYLFRIKQNGQEIDPIEMQGLTSGQVFAPDSSYGGQFVNPALKGQQCDQEDFNL